MGTFAPVTGPGEDTRFTVPWKAGDVVVGVFTAFAAVVVTFVFYSVLAGEPDVGVGLVVVGGIGGVIMLSAAWVLGPVRYDAPSSTLGLRPPARPGLSQWVLPVLALAASLAFAAAYTGVVDLVGWDALRPPDLPEDIALGGPAVLVTYLLVVLWIPFTEEIFFRGYVFPGLAGACGVVQAGVITALLFALAHGQPAVIAPIFFTGLVLAWLYHRTGSIWSSFAAHALQNLLALSVSLAS